MKWKYFLILSCLLSPLFLIQINHQHDVGDDYAQYLDQSRDFLENSQDKEVLNLEDVGPKYRSPFFSLTQVPLITINEFSPKNHLIFQSVIIFLSAIALYILFLSWKVDEWSAIVLTLLSVYNGQFILLKAEIAPEFLFILCVFLSLFFYKKKSFLWCAVFIGLTIATRSIGLTLFLAVFVHFIYKNRLTLLPLSILLCVPLIIWQGFNLLLFGTFSFSDVLWYDAASTGQNVLLTAWDNFWFYKEILSNFFPFQNPFLSVLLNTILLLAFLAGFGMKLKNKIGLREIFFLVYFITLLFYPYQKAGERFLLPLFPLTIYYIYITIKWLVEAYQGDRKLIPFSLFFILIFSSRFTISATTAEEKLGANTESFIEVQAFLKKNSSSSTSIMSFKPWLTHYHFKLPSVGINSATTKTEFNRVIKQYNPNLILICRNPAYQDLYKKEALDWIQNDWTELYRNKDFILYRIK